nr:uncharacterized protein LOC109751726 [Aegilops tauschii subsp. strangulata]
MAFEDIFGSPTSPATSPTSSAAISSGTSPTAPATFSATTAALSTTAAPSTAIAPSSGRSPLNIHHDHISNYIKSKLDPAENNFSKWRTFFRMVLLRYRVQDHVDRPPPCTADADWLAVDQRLVLWMPFTLADPLLELISGGVLDAYTAWQRIADYFLANQGAQILHLTRRYRNLQQGDLPIVEYARRLKALADGLADVGAAVSDNDLTMQLLHGLAPRFETIRIVLGDTNSLPPFGVVRSRLELAEYHLSLRTATDGAAALSIPHGGSGGSGGDGGPGGSGGFGGSDDRGGSRPSSGDRAGPDGAHGRGGGSRGGSNGERGRGRGRGRGESSGRGAPSAPTAPFTGYFAPYGMALLSPRPGWSAPNAAGVLGPRPGVHSQAYPVMLSGPSPPYSAPAGQLQFHPPAPSWDHAALFNHAANQSGFPSNEWYMDTGASSHVTGNQGSSHSDGTHDVQ